MAEPKDLGGTAERGGPAGEVSTSAKDALDNLEASDPDASSKRPESAMSDAVDEAQGQGGMFGRPLAETEAQARAEIAQLRPKLRAPDPEVRRAAAARIAELERLTRRGEAISAEELRTRAQAGEQAPPPRELPGQEEMFTGTGGPLEGLPLLEEGPPEQGSLFGRPSAAARSI